MSKKLLFICITCCIIIFSVGCSNSDDKSDKANSSKENIYEEKATTNSNESSKTETETESNDESLSDEEIQNLLTNLKKQYGNNMGNFSCNRIWVKKTESNYDAVKHYYAYLNEKGEVVGEWHVSRQNEPDNENAWVKPSDYSNNLAIVAKEETKRDGYAGYIYDVIDLDGNVVTSFWALKNTLDDRKVEYIDFDESGHAIYSDGGLGGTTNLHIINSNGEISDIKSEYANDLTFLGKSFSEGYNYYSNWATSRNGAGYFYAENGEYIKYFDAFYFDVNGNIVLDLSDDKISHYLGGNYQIIELFPIENGIAKVDFQGADNKFYIIAIDISTGDLLTESPVPTSERNTYDFDSLLK